MLVHVKLSIIGVPFVVGTASIKTAAGTLLKRQQYAAGHYA
jgi:hypothetical protein